MPSDLATLSLRLTDEQAIADAKAVGAAYEDMGRKGEAAARRLTLSTNPTTEAIKNQAVASVAATRGMGLWSALNAEASGHVGEHSLAIGRLERNLAGVTERFLGLNQTVGLVASSLLKFGVGSIETVGILAGIAAIAAAWEYFTGAARKAREENEKLRTSLEAGNFREALGPAPDLRLETDAQRNQLMQDKEYRRQLMAFGADPNSDKIKQLNVTIAHEADVLRDGVARLTKARMDATTPLTPVRVEGESAEARARKKEEADRKAREDAARYQELVRSTSFSPLSLDYTRTAADMRSRTAGHYQMSDKEQSSLFAPEMKAAADAWKTGAERSVHESVAAYKDGTGKQLEEARKNTDRLHEALFAAAEQGAQIIVEALNVGGGGPHAQKGGQIGGTAGSAIGSFFGRPGEIIGNTIGTIIGSWFGGMSDGAKFAKEAAIAQASVALQLDTLADHLSHNRLAEIIDGLKTSLESQLLAINAALPGTRNEAQRNADRARAQALATQQEEQAREDYARTQKYATEDLAVRNLRATGQGDAASLLAFREAQQREMEQAILDGRDATYQNTLATTQNNELIAYQNGLLSTAFRNAPTGFFASSYYSQFATPRGPAGYPTDSGPNPLGPDPTGGLTPPGGSRGRPVLPQQTIILTVDGKVLTRVVVNNLDQTAAATGGAGSSRSDALNVYH
jgi:hypothetical protein